MEPGFELEDDVFFADLSKRISLLIMDDDDDGDDNSLSRCPAAVNLQAFHQALIHPARSQASTFQNYDHHHHHHQQQQQQQQITSKREISKGTGVFIPLSSHPRRRSAKQGRSLTAATTSKCQRQPSDSYTYNPRGLPHNISYDYNSSSNKVDCRSHDSFHVTRF